MEFREYYTQIIILGEGGAEYVTQNVTFGFGLFWTINNQGPADSRKKFIYPLTI